MKSDNEIIKSRIKECILYPFTIYVNNVNNYYDWLEEMNIRYIVKKDMYTWVNPIGVDEIRFKFSEDLLAFKLKFGL